MNKLNIQEILKYLPHRYPFLLIDKVLEFESGKHLVAFKNVTVNEPYFSGHFPEMPIMPGVLIVEALAQASGIFIYLTSEKNRGLFYFAGIDEVRFHRVIVPGDQLRLMVNLERNKLDVWKFKTIAMVEDEIVCRAMITLAR